MKVRIDLFCQSWYVVRVHSTSHPMVFPNTHHCIGAEGTSRVHAGAREGNCKKMAGGDGQSNGKRSRALNAVLIVLVGSGGKDNKHQHHGDEELHTEGLARSESGVDCGCAKPIPSA